MKLSRADLDRWLTALTSQPRDGTGLLEWVAGPVRSFFPHARVLLLHGEHLAGQIRITHSLSQGYDGACLKQAAAPFDLDSRGSLKWWLGRRQPFVIDPACPPSFATAFELDEIRSCGLGNVAAHGVVNAKANVGTYFSFTGVPGPLTEWHLDALTLIAPVLNEIFLKHVAAQEAPRMALVEQLTPRQKEIARCIAHGYSDKAIALECGISEKTVRNQLTEVYARLNVRSRGELASLLR